MTVESATYIDTLDATYPANGDAVSEGDQHLRLLKSVLQATFTGDPTSSCAVADFALLTGLSTAWASITKPAGFSDTTDFIAKCSKRLGRVELTGLLFNSTAGTLGNGSTVGTLPAGYRPLQPVYLQLGQMLSGTSHITGINFAISTGGVITLNQAWSVSNGDAIYLFGAGFFFESYN